MVVLDATVAVDAALVSGGIEAIVRDSATAPVLLWSEASSALRQLVWREHATEREAGAALDRLLAAGIERRSSRELYEAAWRVARELGWAKTYDAEYVALARLLNCRLVTLDGRLRRAASRLIEVVGPMEM